VAHEGRLTVRYAGDKYFFLKNADQKMTTVIEPLMRGIIKELHSYGQEAVIVKQCQSITPRGTLQYRHITLVLSGDKRKPAYNFSPYPAIGFIADSLNETILVREKRFTAYGKKESITGSYHIDEITVDLVEKYIRAFLPKVSKKV
jgi:hypothetical protein